MYSFILGRTPAVGTERRRVSTCADLLKLFFARKNKMILLLVIYEKCPTTKPFKMLRAIQLRIPPGVSL